MERGILKNASSKKFYSLEIEPNHKLLENSSSRFRLQAI